MPATGTKRLAAGIVLSFVALYTLAGSREPPRGDALGMWYPAVSLVERGEFGLTFPWPPDNPRGRGDRFYGVTPIATALVHVPGALLAAAGVAVAPEAADFWTPFASHLAPAVLGALTCLAFFGLCRELGASVRSASVATVFLGCGSTIFVYARAPYSEILQAALFTGFFGATLRAARHPRYRSACTLGVLGGLLLNSKYLFVLTLAGAALWLAVAYRRHQIYVRVLAIAGLATLPFAVLGAWYNVVRWGSVWSTGYGPYLAGYFDGSLLDGAWGMLFSVNKSVFLYSPPLLLATFALPRTVRRRRDYGWALLFLLLPVVLVYAVYRSWSGDYAWGPRFLVFAVPVLMAPLAPWLDTTAGTWNAQRRRALLIAVFVWGAAVQVVGTAVYWDHYVRIAMRARDQWLGSPNRAGAHIAERGRGHCDSCFEDMYPVQWLPPFNPIRGHWWLLCATMRGADAPAAERSAPWRRYTDLRLDIAAPYARVRLDWWVLLWLRDVPAARTPGGIAMALGLLMGVGGVVLWRRSLEAASSRSEGSC